MPIIRLAWAAVSGLRAASSAPASLGGRAGLPGRAAGFAGRLARGRRDRVLSSPRTLYAAPSGQLRGATGRMPSTARRSPARRRSRAPDPNCRSRSLPSDPVTTTENAPRLHGVALDAAATSRCRRRVHLDHDPAAAGSPRARPDPALQQRRADAAEHRVRIGERLAAATGPGWHEVPDAGSTAERIAATAAAVAADAPLIWGAVLPDADGTGRRGGAELLVRLPVRRIPADHRRPAPDHRPRGGRAHRPGAGAMAAAGPARCHAAGSARNPGTCSGWPTSTACCTPPAGPRPRPTGSPSTAG